jgi:tRNA(adenine34) deaminase
MGRLLLCEKKSMLSVLNPEYYMKQALLEAKCGEEEGEIPIGAIIVYQNRIISRAHNQTERLLDVTAHAEILAITSACALIGSKYLIDCSIYVTIEPCPMCAAALKWAKIETLVYGAEDKKNGFMQFGKEMLHPKTKVLFGISHDECKELMQSFFKKRRH